MSADKLRLFIITAIIAGCHIFNLSAFAEENISRATISGVRSWENLKFEPALTKGCDIEITVTKESYLLINNPIQVGNILFKGSGGLTVVDNGSLTCKHISYGTIDLTYTYNANGKALVLDIEGTGNFTKDGIGEITMNLPTADTQTLTIANGKLTHTGSISGTLNIMRSGVYCEGQDDGLNAGGAPIVDVHGVLDINTHYWIVSNDACINLYPESKVVGKGNGEYQAFEFQQPSGKINVIKFNDDGGIAKFESTIGLRAGDVIVDIEDGMVFDYANTSGIAGDINNSLIANGNGIFKLEPVATLGEHWLIMNDGVLDLSAFTDTILTKIKVSNQVACIFPYDIEDDEYTWDIDYDKISKILKVKKVHILEATIGTLIYIT